MDLSSATELENSDAAIPINNHFKLYAGPGAGKTSFLVNHVKRILAETDRLAKSRKIACITYTNIGVDTLKTKLDDTASDVEISTIHSFLYKHVVQPYLWKLEDCPFPIEKLNGHDEVRLRYKQLEKFKKDSGQTRFFDDMRLEKVLRKITWKLVDGTPELGFIRVGSGKVGKYSIKKTSYSIYKEICWEEGNLSHDDVLYFSYKLLSQERRIREVIRAKFPYILIDEFQDTSPLQAEIIKLIVEKESILGVIGDPCQAIFSFQGTDDKLFDEFSMNGMQLYIINDNRRSTEQIITVLNHMRKDRDFRQQSVDAKQGDEPIILVGTSSQAQDYLEKVIGNEELYTLAFKNSVVKSIELKLDEGLKDNINIDELDIINADGDRGWRIHFIIHAIEYGKQLKITEAIKLMKKAYRKTDSFSERDAFINLKRFLDEYDNFSDENMTKFNNEFISGNYGVKEKVARGEKKKFFDSLTYKQLAATVKVEDDISSFKTIHKSKGDEFDNVLVIARAKKEDLCIEFLLKPDMGKEEHRVYYVALSRAKKRLYINVPSLSEGKLKKVGKLGINIVQLAQIKEEN